MPINLDSCIAGVFTPGNIGASSGLPPVVRTVPSLDGVTPAVAEITAASDAVDFFMGELLYEAVSALDSYTATGGAYSLLVNEAAAAADTVYLAQVFNEVVGENAPATDAPAVYVPGAVDAAVAETAAATDAPDATITSAVTYATFDGVKSSNITLSNGNLTATNTDGTGNTGARSTSAKTSGKHYFEITRVSTSGGGFASYGLLTTGGTYANLVANGTNCTAVIDTTIYSNNSSTFISVGAVAAGHVISVAVDLDARKAWFRRNGGNWNDNVIGSQNPATGTGGVTVQASVAFAPAVGFGSFTSSQSITGNFGQSAFTYAVPSGFTSGWTA